MTMKLRIWHIINIPGAPFRMDVPDVPTAVRALWAIAQYDLFLGDGTKPWTTVGGRQAKRAELAGKDKFLRTMFAAYDRYQLERCPGGLPLVASNVQGLETFEAEDNEWCEFYNDNGDDIRAIADAAATVAAG